ncbi:hypothetical protein QC762_0009490 [Podospora pseudocomata]|uniref:Uncharacterized protein n=1 Tax=Podospora pseudocomata TaxID=2093779 RepID=A0ABR0GV50_9PEZI|nr:hypothetical protein QC762_0009490 [Podospora pseudocomata]
MGTIRACSSIASSLLRLSLTELLARLSWLVDRARQTRHTFLFHGGPELILPSLTRLIISERDESRNTRILPTWSPGTVPARHLTQTEPLNGSRFQQLMIFSSDIRGECREEGWARPRRELDRSQQILQ